MSKPTELNEKPTRKRPLQIQVSDEEGALVIVLIGPDARMRRRLFTRLGTKPRTDIEDHRFDAAKFGLGGVTIDLVDWHSSLDPMESLAVLGKASFALCIDPEEKHDHEAFAFFAGPLREGLFANACVALISDGKHLDAQTERDWTDRLDDSGAHCKVLRVNCGDSMSPELFAKLFLAGVRDDGDDDHGILVQEIDR